MGRSWKTCQRQEFMEEQGVRILWTSQSNRETRLMMMILMVLDYLIVNMHSSILRWPFYGSLGGDNGQFPLHDFSLVFFKTRRYYNHFVKYKWLFSYDTQWVTPAIDFRVAVNHSAEYQLGNHIIFTNVFEHKKK